MVDSIRSQYNAAFSAEKYEAMKAWMNKVTGEEITFRICETPVFIPKELAVKLREACDEITEQLTRPDIKEITHAAVEKLVDVPNETAHTRFLQLDFGICEDENGEAFPQLIELQGFPSLYFFQHLLASAYKNHFDIPKNLHSLQSGLDEWAYIDIMFEAIVGKHKPEEVVLLEIEPHKQNTRVDFWLTKAYMGIKILCLSKVIREGDKIFYENEKGEKIRIKRIYNRVIFDELQKRDDLPRQWSLTEEVDVEWGGHPNWFMRLSKYILPFLKSKYVPKTYFLKGMTEYPKDLENWVLKPIFSFSGEGVMMDFDENDLKNLTNKDNYILQKKMPYKAIIDAPGEEKVKFEVRMMFVWLDDWEKPMLVNNLVRMSKGKMVGVKYNKDKDWVGASVGFFPKV